MRKTLVIGISLLFFIGIASHVSAKKIHCWDFIQNNVCDIEEDINGDGKCNGRDCENEETCYAIPQTGQTNCYNIAGIEIDCAGTGQDGEYQYGTPFPEPRFTDNKDDTVTDNMTGLMWTIDANLMASRDPGFDADGVSGDGAVTWQHALDYVAKLNQEAYLGFTDWRMPNVREMLSLIDYGYRRPTLTPDHPFINVESYPAVYWSSTSYVGSDDVFHVVIGNGTVNHVGRDGSKYVWPVRGGN